MRYAKRRDANHGSIRSALEAIGAGVYDAAGDGSPYDFLVFWRGNVYICEVKDGAKSASRRKLTVKEVQLHELARKHGVGVRIIETEDQALALVGARRMA